ncbi:MAG: hypothetical protein KDB27_28040, partial [Planctomycetales bacterium]|nr:hypothetical protein [Planctomycetales bacterium]
AVVVVGYIIATACFMVVVLLRLHVRSILTIAAVTAGWLAVTYVLFMKFLYVPLPSGALWGSLSG